MRKTANPIWAVASVVAISGLAICAGCGNRAAIVASWQMSAEGSVVDFHLTATDPRVLTRARAVVTDTTGTRVTLGEVGVRLGVASDAGAGSPTLPMGVKVWQDGQQTAEETIDIEPGGEEQRISIPSGTLECSSFEQCFSDFEVAVELANPTAASSLTGVVALRMIVTAQQDSREPGAGMGFGVVALP